MDDCNELLENIQKSLHYCCNNTHKYKFSNPINRLLNPLQCENITKYEQSLRATKTEINFIILINTQKEYFINYNCDSRKITIFQ
jgi:hypothetical protein